MEPKGASSAPAMTVADAAKLKSSSLKLVHHRLTDIPAGIRELRSLTSLDLSDNPISDVGPQLLPPSLQCLWITGCAVERVPAGLPNLEQLFASANRVTSIDGLFSSTALLHAGLSYNHISTLATRNASPSSSSSSSGSLGHCRLMSLDLAHNDISSLGSALQVLGRLPQLRSLCLKGNPVCLRPVYAQTVMEALPQLLILDGQRLDGTPTAAASTSSTAAMVKQPDSARPTPARRPRSAEGSTSKLSVLQLQECAPDTPLLLELSGLQLHDRPEALFGRIRAAALAAAADAAAAAAVAAAAATGAGGAAGAEAAAAAAAAAADTAGSASRRTSVAAGAVAAVAGAAQAAAAAADVVVPLRHILYHVEWEDMHGTRYASTCTSVPPPARVTEEEVSSIASKSPEPSKKGGAGPNTKGGKAGDAKARGPSAKSKGKPGAKGPKGGPQGDGDGAAALQPLLRPGYCRVLVQLQADVACRDWLRTGGNVDLYRTHFAMFPAAPAAGATAADAASAAPAAAAPAPAAKAAAGKGGKGAAAAAAPAPTAPDPAALWRYEPQRELLGSCRLTAAAALLEGTTYLAEGTLEFVSDPALFDKHGIRKALEDPRQPKHALGSMGYSMQLHYSAAVEAGAAAEPAPV